MSKMSLYDLGYQMLKEEKLDKAFNSFSAAVARSYVDNNLFLRCLSMMKIALIFSMKYKFKTAKTVYQNIADEIINENYYDRIEIAFVGVCLCDFINGSSKTTILTTIASYKEILEKDCNKLTFVEKLIEVRNVTEFDMLIKENLNLKDVLHEFKFHLNLIRSSLN